MDCPVRNYICYFIEKAEYSTACTKIKELKLSPLQALDSFHTSSDAHHSIDRSLRVGVLNGIQVKPKSPDNAELMAVAYHMPHTLQTL